MFSYYEVDYVIYNQGSGRDFLELYYNFWSVIKSV